MIVSAQANIRVASAARRSYEEALVLCLKGAFSAILARAMCIGGITILYIMVYMMYGSSLSDADLPMLLTGYGFELLLPCLCSLVVVFTLKLLTLVQT